MSAPRLQDGVRPSVSANTRDFQVIDYGEEYQKLIADSLAENGGVTSFICNGAVVSKIDPTVSDNDRHIGRGLLKSYVTDAYNAACDNFPDNDKFVEHCLFRTVGSTGHVLDYDDRVWSNDTAGAYMTLITGSDIRSSVLDATDQILDGPAVKPLQKAYLDALLLPMVQVWSEEELSCEAMMYVKVTFSELTNQLKLEDFVGVRDAVQNIDEPNIRFGSNLLAMISIEMNLPTPIYTPLDGYVHRYAQSLVGIARDGNDVVMSKFYKVLIDSVSDVPRSGLLIALFLDSYLSWAGEDEELQNYADHLEENEDLPEPINPSEVPEHRAITSDTILDAATTTEVLPVRGGKIMPAELGEISTTDLRGRKVGTVDKRRVVAFIEDGQLIVQFKNARNYFFNVLYLVRPGTTVRTEVREQVIDHDRLVGLPALHLLLLGRTSRRLARFVLAALTYKSVSMKQCNSSSISVLFGEEEGAMVYNGSASPSVLNAFPVLVDEQKELYLYHDGRTYRLQFRAMAWHISEEELSSTPIGFGNLVTPYPLK